MADGEREKRSRKPARPLKRKLPVDIAACSGEQVWEAVCKTETSDSVPPSSPLHQAPAALDSSKESPPPPRRRRFLIEVNGAGKAVTQVAPGPMPVIVPLLSPPLAAPAASPLTRAPQLHSATGEEEAGVAPCPQAPCSWCQKVGQRRYALPMGGEIRAFCSDKCFSAGRRAHFKRNKVCDWCKQACQALEYLGFGEGERRLRFCSDKCLGRYKIDVFYSETRANLPAPGSAAPHSSSSSSTPADDGDKPPSSATPDRDKGGGGGGSNVGAGNVAAKIGNGGACPQASPAQRPRGAWGEAAPAPCGAGPGELAEPPPPRSSPDERWHRQQESKFAGTVGTTALAPIKRDESPPPPPLPGPQAAARGPRPRLLPAPDARRGGAARRADVAGAPPPPPPHQQRDPAIKKSPCRLLLPVAGKVEIGGQQQQHNHNNRHHQQQHLKQQQHQQMTPQNLLPGAPSTTYPVNQPARFAVPVFPQVQLPARPAAGAAGGQAPAGAYPHSQQQHHQQQHQQQQMPPYPHGGQQHQFMMVPPLVPPPTLLVPYPVLVPVPIPIPIPIPVPVPIGPGGWGRHGGNAGGGIGAHVLVNGGVGGGGAGGGGRDLKDEVTLVSVKVEVAEVCVADEEREGGTPLAKRDGDAGSGDGGGVGGDVAHDNDDGGGAADLAASKLGGEGDGGGNDDGDDFADPRGDGGGEDVSEDVAGAATHGEDADVADKTEQHGGGGGGDAADGHRDTDEIGDAHVDAKAGDGTCGGSGDGVAGESDGESGGESGGGSGGGVDGESGSGVGVGVDGESGSGVCGGSGGRSAGGVSGGVGFGAAVSGTDAGGEAGDRVDAGGAGGTVGDAGAARRAEPLAVVDLTLRKLTPRPTNGGYVCAEGRHGCAGTGAVGAALAIGRDAGGDGGSERTSAEKAVFPNDGAGVPAPRPVAELTCADCARGSGGALR